MLPPHLISRQSQNPIIFSVVNVMQSSGKSKEPTSSDHIIIRGVWVMGETPVWPDFLVYPLFSLCVRGSDQ